MAYQYTSKENVKLIAVPEANLDNTDTAARIDAYINAVSEFVDRYTDRPAGYFLPTTEAAERRYRGEGKNYLRVGRYHADFAFVSPTVGASSVYYDANGWPRWNDQPLNDQADYFPTDQPFFGAGSLYVVSAKWGFAATPADIATATALFAGKLWDLGEGVIGEVTPTGFVIERDMPPTVRLLLDQWKRREFELN